MAQKEKKRYFLSVVEEMIQNSEYFGFRGGRIEVYDNESDSSYALLEIRFFIPEWMIEPFRKMFDFKELTEKEMKYLRLSIDGEAIINGERKT